MDRKDPVILTNLCMVYDGSRVLVEEKVGKDYKGIIFPGGHVEEGEPVTDSVIREIREETGLAIRSPKLCGIKEWFNEDGSRYMVFLYKTDQFSGELKSSEEGKVFWTDMADLPSLPLMWHMDTMMSIFTQGDFSELFLDASDKWKEILK